MFCLLKFQQERNKTKLLAQRNRICIEFTQLRLIYASRKNIPSNFKCQEEKNSYIVQKTSAFLFLKSYVNYSYVVNSFCFVLFWFLFVCLFVYLFVCLFVFGFFFCHRLFRICLESTLDLYMNVGENVFCSVKYLCFIYFIDVLCTMNA